MNVTKIIPICNFSPSQFARLPQLNLGLGKGGITSWPQLSLL